MSEMLTISVCMACFNRRNDTLKCLRSLVAQDGLNEEWKLRVFLLDDSSSDGTVAAVRWEFPDVVIIQGTGTMFWGRGMNAAMSAALSSPSHFLLLLNDDVTLVDDAIQFALSEYDEARRLKDDPRQIIVGPVTEPHRATVTYSGFERLSRLNPTKIRRLPPDPNGLSRCDTMNGNFVLIPYVLAKRLGAIDRTFIHQLGDLDYGYRAVQAGGSLWIARRPIGSCPANLRTFPFQKPGLNMLERWRKINSPLGLPLRSWFTFMWRHGGVIGLLFLIGMYCKRVVGR